MLKRNYTKVQELLPEMMELVSEGMTQRKIAEHLGLKDKYVIKRLFNRERRKAARLAAGIAPQSKGRPRKGAVSRDVVAEQAYEINRLKMENELLRDFLQSAGRK